MFIMNKSKYVIYILVIVLIIIALGYIIKINKKDLPEQENSIKINEIENSEGKYDIYDKKYKIRQNSSFINYKRKSSRRSRNTIR